MSCLGVTLVKGVIEALDSDLIVEVHVIVIFWRIYLPDISIMTIGRQKMSCDKKNKLGTNIVW